MKTEKELQKRKKITRASQWGYDPYKTENETSDKPLDKNIQVIVDNCKF